LKRILIIGNSAAGVATAESLRAQDKQAKIAIVSDEPFMAYEGHKVLDYLQGAIKEKDIYFKNQDFYKNNSIDLLLEREVTELNLNKKKAIFKDREFFEFDFLVIASGLRVQMPALKGVQKEGVIGLNGLKEAKFLIENLPIAHTVIVSGESDTAQRVSKIVAGKKIEVKFLGKTDAVIEGVDVIQDNPITEILGDSEVRAIRLSNNKVIGASIVVFCSPMVPKLDFLKDTGIAMDRSILVDNEKRTSIPFIFAVGDCAYSGTAKTDGWQEALEEGAQLGSVLCRI